MSALDTTIGFLGAGKMASALAAGWINANLLSSEKLIASDPHEAAREAFQEQTKARVTNDNREVLRSCEVIFLAIKPQVMSELFQELTRDIHGGHLIVSIAAGVSIQQIQESLPGASRVVRVMPNTPCLVGEMAAGYCPSARATEVDVAIVDRLLNAVGRAFQLQESLLDAVTGLSGSGPAHIAVIIAAIADGGVRLRLPRDVALTLATQTVLGTAKLIGETSIHPAQLKDMVSSPGGTTIAGLHELERGGVRAALMNAVEAATKRSEQLGSK